MKNEPESVKTSQVPDNGSWEPGVVASGLFAMFNNPIGFFLLTVGFLVTVDVLERYVTGK
jgi:hypothetical protein